MTETVNICIVPDDKLTPDKYQLFSEDAVAVIINDYGNVAVYKEEAPSAKEMDGELCLIESITKNSVKALELGVCCGRCGKRVFFRPLD